MEIIERTSLVQPSDLSPFAITMDPVTATVRITGELDLATAPMLEHAADWLRSAGAAELTVDLDGVRFIDAAGVGTLVALSRTQAGDGARLVVIGASGRLRRVFALTGTEWLLELPGSTLEIELSRLRVRALAGIDGVDARLNPRPA